MLGPAWLDLVWINRQQSESLSATAARAAIAAADVVVVTGDHADRGQLAEVETFLDQFVAMVHSVIVHR